MSQVIIIQSLVRHILYVGANRMYCCNLLIGNHRCVAQFMGLIDAASAMPSD
jgi:hypothetical protein